MASARPSRRTRSWTRTTVVAAAALTLAGCSATNPITTAESYNVVDGVQVDVGSSVAARSLLVLTAGEGEVGAMAGALTNAGREDVEVTVEPDGADAVTIDVPARGTVLLGGEDGEEIALERVAAAPGALLTVTLSTPDGGSSAVQVPVLDATLPEYSDAVPESD